MENKLGMFAKRISRGAYVLRFFCIFIFLLIVLGALSNFESFDINNIGPFGGIILLISLFYLTLLNIQRLNDLELSRWYILLWFFPLISIFFTVAMLARKGKSVVESTKEAGLSAGAIAGIIVGIIVLAIILHFMFDAPN